MSLLDAGGVHLDHSSVIIDQELQEDLFGYPLRRHAARARASTAAAAGAGGGSSSVPATPDPAALATEREARDSIFRIRDRHPRSTWGIDSSNRDESAINR